MKNGLKNMAKNAVVSGLGVLLGLVISQPNLYYSENNNTAPVEAAAIQDSNQEMSLRDLAKTELADVNEKIYYGTDKIAETSRVIPVKVLKKTSETSDDTTIEETPAKVKDPVSTPDQEDMSGQPVNVENNVAVTQPQVSSAPAVIEASAASQPALHVTPVASQPETPVTDVNIDDIVNTVTGGSNTEDITPVNEPAAPSFPTGLDDLDNGSVSTTNGDGYLAQ